MPAAPDPLPAAPKRAAPLTIRHAAIVHPCERVDEAPLLDAFIRIEGDTIAAIGREPCPATDGGETIDARRMLVIPGLVNLHHHFGQSITRAMPDGLSCGALPWLQAMLPLWREADADLHAAAVRLAAAELLLTGATTSVDMPYLFPGGGNALLDLEVEAVREMGLRLELVRGATTELAPPLAATLGGDAPSVVETPKAALAATREAIARHHDGSPRAMTRIGVGALYVTYDEPDAIAALARLAAETGTLRHTHLTPREDEVALCLSRFGCRPVALLERLGWLGEGSFLAHGSRLEAEDIAILARTGTGLSHSPHQNMRLGFPAGPVPECRAAGVRVGFGVDGCASNDSASMFAELRAGHMIHRLAGTHADYGPEHWLTAREVLFMATRDSAAILGREDIGRLAPGMAADIVLVALDQVAFAGGLHDPLSTLLFAGSSVRADTVLVNGKVVVRGGRLAAADEARIVADAHHAAAAIVARAEQRTGRRWQSLAAALAPSLPSHPH